MMKKTTVVLIGLIYFVSIILVGVYGLQYKQFNQVVYATSVKVINPTDKYATDPDTGEQIKTYFVYKDEDTGLRQFQIDWRIDPIETVTNKKVRFIYQSSPNYKISETGLVEFFGQDVITITIVPDDGSNCQDKIMIYCMN